MTLVESFPALPPPLSYFRPGGAGNLNFYGYSERDGFLGFSIKQEKSAGPVTAPLLETAVQVNQVTYKADAQGHAIRQAVPARTPPVGFIRHIPEA